MSNTTLPTVLVVGAGVMGAGIAQIAAQAGHRVHLYDAQPGAAATTRARLAQTLQTLADKGKLDAASATAATARLHAIDTLEQAASGVGLVVEAIVENLEIKRQLFQQIEAWVDATAILATNTSSISVTAIAHGLQRPERLVGMHFFNPVPLMKLVEVVAGLRTDAAVAQQVFTLAQQWGKTPVHARSTPGFIVNRIARPFYAEALALLLEQATTPAVLDAALKAVGFRMGPCELIDLIGHDVNFAVSQTVFQANFGDRRYVPSLVQREMVEGGLLGRKSGQGFYRYADGKPVATAEAVTLPVPTSAAPQPSGELIVHGHGPQAQRWQSALQRAGHAFGTRADSDWIGLQVGTAQLRQSDGRTATHTSAATGVTELAVYDLHLPRTADADAAIPLAFASSATASPAWAEQAAAWLALAGYAPLPVQDAAGLIVTRTLAMLINEASDAVLQGVCSDTGADTAMKLGLNYPQGPFEWLAAWDAQQVAQVIDHLDAHYRGERYRVSPLLRARAQIARLYHAP